MVVGTGQLAKVFESFQDKECLIFASGVSNSSCIDIKQFEREKNLLIETLKSNDGKKFVYFSSCALSANDYPKNAYYQHKEAMEDIIKIYSTNYYIFRIPQLFGDLILHKTLINFIYKAIVHEHKLHVYDEAYRYVIEIHDVQKIVEMYVKNHTSCVTVDIANTYRYKVLEIVKIFERLLDKEAHYDLISKDDHYTLDLTSMHNFINDFELKLGFGENYLMEKLKEKLR